MNLQRKLRQLAKRALMSRNLVLTLPGHFDLLTHKLKACKRRGLIIESAIDGGASTGRWAEELRSVYPGAKLLCIEPRAEACQKLREMAARLGNVTVAETLIGAHSGTSSFYRHGDQSSTLRYSHPAELMTMPVTTLDELVRSLAFPLPHLIKLDLQGGELQALRGATRCLEAARAVLLECSFLRLYEDAPLIADVFAHMRENNFVCYDVLAMWNRPLDGALAQGDFLFVRTDSSLVQDARWGANSGS